ncbi:Uncharacterised protein [Mycobacterium tuberculosis]|nr:Uncharacterised protein [Mycobacterium tuberculosis]
MFSTDRYVTRGVNEVVPFELQRMLWSILERRQERGDELDYLKVFELPLCQNSCRTPLKNV